MMEGRHVATLCWLSFGIGMSIRSITTETISTVILIAVTVLWLVSDRKERQQ